MGFRTNDGAMLDRLKSLIPPHATPSDQQAVRLLVSLRVGKPSKQKGVKNYHLVYHAWDRVVRTLDLEEALATFEETLRTKAATYAASSIFLAGSLYQNGSEGVIFCGSTELRSGPQLEARLSQGGLNKLTDRYVGLTESGMAFPYENPLLTPVPGKALYLLDAEAQGVSRLTPGEAVVALIAQGSLPGYDYETDRALKSLAALCEVTPSYRVASIEEAEKLIQEHVPA